MGLYTSGDVIRKAREEGVPEEHLEEFVRKFHSKSQYLGSEQAFQACLLVEKKWAYGGYPGEIPAPSTVGEPVRRPDGR